MTQTRDDRELHARIMRLRGTEQILEHILDRYERDGAPWPPYMLVGEKLDYLRGQRAYLEGLLDD